MFFPFFLDSSSNLYSSLLFLSFPYAIIQAITIPNHPPNIDVIHPKTTKALGGFLEIPLLFSLSVEYDNARIYACRLKFQPTLMLLANLPDLNF